MMNNDLQQWTRDIQAVDKSSYEACQSRLDNKTKPRGSLGRIEDLACQLASVYRTTDFQLGRKAIVVMAGDHGVAQEGVSAFPSEVTAQMVLNFTNGGAAINALAKQSNCELVVVDMGVKVPLPQLPQLRSSKIAAGTQNLAKGPAMSEGEANAAVQVGFELASELASDGVGVIGLGEMGIANTTASSALCAALTGTPVSTVVGRGTGIDDAALQRKIEVVEQGLTVNGLSVAGALMTPMQILARVGGFEIAGLCGVVLGAAANKVPVVVDGFITSVAALVATRVEPRVRSYLIPSHQSVEVGHRVVLRELGLTPLFDLEMRLGEGSGAALAMHFVDAAAAILNEMATFESASVSDSGA